MRHYFVLLGFLVFTVNQRLKAQALQNELNTIMTNNDVMGMSVVVFCKDGIKQNIALGKSDWSRNIDMTTESKYRIASISKTITAIAVMQLVEQNLLDLDADISDILGYEVKNPNHPNTAITTRMLLSHTSTIIDGSTYSSFLGASVNDNPIPNLSTILTVGGQYYIASQFNNTTPGTYFNYSNINYVILGTLIEKVSSTRFDVYCKQNIFDPLEIDASFNVNDLTDIDQVAVLYRKPGGVWTAQIDDYQGVQPTFSNLTDYEPGTNGGRFGPQGGLRCSAEDVAKIFLCLMNEGTFGASLLTPSSVSQMLSNQWTFSGNNGNNYFGLFRSWGLGIHRITSTPGNDVALPGSTQMFGHAGEAYGLVSDAYFDTLRNVGFVFVNNGVGVGYQSNNNSVFYTIEQQVFNAIETHGNLAGCMHASLNSQLNIERRIFPNPSGEWIQFSDGISFSSYRILDSTGKVVRNIKLKNAEQSVNISDLHVGSYFIEIDGNSYEFMKN